MPIIPAQRNLPNQINLVENAMAPFQATRPLLSGLAEFEDAVARVETEEARTEAAELLSSVVIRQKEALSTDKKFDDPDLYSEHVLKKWKKARTEVEKQTKNPLTRTLLRLGIARSEASLADDFGTRISNLREFKAQGHVISYLDNVKKEASTLPIKDRLRRYDAASRYIDSSSAFRADQREKLKIKLGEDMDEAAVVARLSGLPNDPTYRDPTAALDLLSIQNTPFLSDKKREDLTNRAYTLKERLEKQGKKLSEVERDEAMSKMWSKIFMEKGSEDEVLRDMQQLIKDRTIDIHTDPDQVTKWLGERRNGVGGSRDTATNILNEFYSFSDPATGRPDPPTNADKAVRYMKRAAATPMNPDDKATLQKHLFSVHELIKARRDSSEFRDMVEHFRVIDEERELLRKGYSSYFETHNIIGVRNKADKRFTDLVASGVPARQAREQVQREFPAQPVEGTGGGGAGQPTKAGDVGGSSTTGGSPLERARQGVRK